MLQRGCNVYNFFGCVDSMSHFTHYGQPPLHRRLIQSLSTLWNVWFGEEEAVVLPANTVVVVLDVIVPYSSLWTSKRTDALQTMLRKVRGRGHRVFFTRWCRTRQIPDDVISRQANAHWSYFLPDSAVDSEHKSTLLLPQFVECHDDVVDTVYTNLLAHSNVQLPPRAPLLLCGMWTESCVVNTARAATEQNREVFVYAPACAGHIGWYALWTIQALYGRVVHRLL